MKNKLFLYCIFSVIFILVSCGYSKDKLVIKNTTNEDICYDLLAKDVSKSVYYQVSTGGKIKKFTSESPIIHTTIRSISDEIKDETNDGNLYILFHNEDIQDYVYSNMHNNMDNLIHNKNIKSHKYSVKELDSLNWIITYDGN